MEEFYDMIVYGSDQMFQVRNRGSLALFHFAKENAFAIHSFVDREDRNREEGLMAAAEGNLLADTTVANVVGIVALSMADHRDHQDPADVSWFDQFESHDHEKVREAAQWGKNHVLSERD
jgi:hypothetical protein